MTQPELDLVFAALQDPSSVTDDTHWAHVAGSLGIGGSTLGQAKQALHDESGTFASAKTWQELVQHHVARQKAFGRDVLQGKEGSVPYPPVTVLPSRGGAPKDAILQRTSVGDVQLCVVPSQAVAVVRNRTGTL